MRRARCTVIFLTRETNPIMRSVKLTAAFLPWLFVSFLASPHAAWPSERSAEPEAPLNERIFRVPVQASPPISLEVTVYMPAHSPRGGPFPLALINHGASHDPANAPRVGDQFIPWYFLSRGYAIAIPMMRGYAHSYGYTAPHGCDVLAIGADAAQDIRKVLDYVKDLPGIDASQIVMVGKSMGGWNTLVFGATNPPDVRGLLNFAGGVKESDCSRPDESLISAAGELGARTRLPSIWFYGENDQTFSNATWRGMYGRYTAAGGHAQLVDYGAFQKDAHAMTASGAGLPLWMAKADAFLASIGMPSREVGPEYLPRPRTESQRVRHDRRCRCDPLSQRAGAGVGSCGLPCGARAQSDGHRQYERHLGVGRFRSRALGDAAMLVDFAVLPALCRRQHGGMAAPGIGTAAHRFRAAAGRCRSAVFADRWAARLCAVSCGEPAAGLYDRARRCVGGSIGRRSDQRRVGAVRHRPRGMPDLFGGRRCGVGGQITVVS